MVQDVVDEVLNIGVHSFDIHLLALVNFTGLRFWVRWLYLTINLSVAYLSVDVLSLFPGPVVLIWDSFRPGIVLCGPTISIKTAL